MILPFINNKTLGLPFNDSSPPTHIERKLYTAKSGILDYPINLLNGKIRKLKYIKSLEDIERIVEKGEMSFSTSFFVDVLRIPKNLITDFVYYCAEDKGFEKLLETTKKNVLAEFFQEKANLYKEYKEVE